jgi:FMNH2-dependent dimethyl sulfone monooxygenase
MEILKTVWSQDGEIRHQGKYFDLDGWLVGPHPVQKPLPLIVSAGASDAGREFAGHYADYIFMPGRTPLDELQKRFNDIKRVAVDHGRPADAVKLQMHVSVVVRESKKEAEEFSNWIAETVDLEAVPEYLNGVRNGISTYDDIYRSLGELQMRQVGSVAGSRKIHGSADEVADHIELLQQKFGCDGIAVTFPVWNPDEVRNFGALVLPRLQAKGMWTAPETRGYGW